MRHKAEQSLWLCQEAGLAGAVTASPVGLG